jgi:hypothetical protein
VGKTKRVTVFQVMVNGEVVDEYFDPVSARNKATEVEGRIQLTARNIPVE